MPRHKSCRKRMKTSAKARIRNRADRSELRSILRAVRAEQNKAKATALLREANSLLDQAAVSGIVHWRNAARNKSRLAQHIERLR